MGHFKEQFPSLLQYAQNLANTVYESIKKTCAVGGVLLHSLEIL